MSAKQLLALPHLASSQPGFVCSPAAALDVLENQPIDFALATLAIVHSRFSNNEIFRLGVLSGENEFQSAQLILEPSHSVQRVLDHVAAADRENASEIPEECAVLLYLGTGPLPSLITDHGLSIEAVYQIDPATGSLIIHVRGDQFDARVLSDWSYAWARVASHVAGSPQQRETSIGQIILISPEVRDRVIGFGQIDDPLTRDFYSLSPSTEFTFHRQFESQVKRSPERIAVWAKEAPSDTEGNEWTYQQLNQRANAIARFLIDAGIEHEDSVGIVMQRRAVLLAALIGVMKAGGRYVALEPELPTDRLAFMANDSSVRFLITENGFVDRAGEIQTAAIQEAAAENPDAALQAPMTVLDVDGVDFESFTSSLGDLDENPDVGVDSTGGCYTIYTSGSTGRPKGVEVCHHSLVNFCHVITRMLGFGPEDTSAAMSTIAFDASVGELYPLLLVGGRVAIGHKQIGANGKQLSDLIESVDATYMAATPTSLRVLVASGWQQSPKLTVIAGGEAVTPLVRDEIKPRIKRLVNGYGPTECTVYSTFGILDDTPGPVPLGGPLLNSRLYVLDEAGNPVPPMVRGRLFIGGQLPARGYLNRPELTAEKFVTDPFVNSDNEPHPRMYDSGDVVYWDHNGVLYYIGRSDHQIKLRGYRIEAGEIEAKLKQHAAVDDVIAMVREDEPGEQRLVAYVIYNHAVADEVLQDHLLVDMPQYMVPTWFVPMDTFPTNANQKLDRKALPLPEDVEPLSLDPSGATDVAANDLASAIAEIWSTLLNRNVRLDDQVFRMGADSLKAVEFRMRLADPFGHDVPVAEIFQYPTARSLAAHLSGAATAMPSGNSAASTRWANPADRTAARHDIAVVGMSGRFPDAPNLEKYWENLRAGREAIRHFSRKELEEAGVVESTYLQPNYVPRGSVLPGAYEFEPEFFGITRQDAQVVSPQIRLFMKTAWETLEHAGYPVEPTDQRIGVYAGGGMPNYLAAWDHVPERQRLQRLIGNGADFLATRTSYALGLTGPSVAVQTACSTSLVAVVQACMALRSGQCDMALAGGSSLSWPHAQGYQHGEGLIYSSDGHCRAFDSRASGTVFSHGAGAVLLRPLADAIAAGDTVHAVIRGVGINNDGDRKGGYAAPSIEGQAEVIRMALQDSGVSPRDISYVEAHGTGTMIGDPIEVAGLSAAWRSYTQDKQFCAIGSVKTNIGHADAAAGIAGLLKLILSLKARQQVANINYESPNPSIRFEDSPFFVQTQNTPWETEDNQTRLAAMSALGMGGTNAHVVLAEAPPVETPTAPVPASASKQGSSPQSASSPIIVPFSARTDDSLGKTLAIWKDESPITADDSFADVVTTLQQGRKHFRRRGFAVASSTEQLIDALRGPTQTIWLPETNACRRKVAFLFTGQGAQYSQMAARLSQQEPVFRNTLGQCDRLLREHLSDGLLSWLYSASPIHDINQTQFAQLALFSVEYAQAKLWQSWGIEPEAMVGHSLGEYVAATIAEVMSLEDALMIVAHRGRLMQSMVPGSMLAVMHGSTPIADLIEGRSDLDLAVVNTDHIAVISGETQTIESFQNELETRGVRSKKLVTSHAFHSAMMEPMLDEFTEIVGRASLKTPQIPYLSNASGTWITDAQTTDPKYYALQLRSTVRFAENLSVLGEDAAEPLLTIEMGPGSTLTQLAKSQWTGSNHVAIDTLPDSSEADQDDSLHVRVALGKAWSAGLELDWDKTQPSLKRGRRIPLPVYQFDEQTYRAKRERIGVDSSKSDEAGRSGAWYNVPSWKQIHLDGHAGDEAAARDGTAAPSETPPDPLCLLLADEHTFAPATVRQWIGGAQVVMVRAGRAFRRIASDEYEIRPGEPQDYMNLIAELNSRGTIVNVLHGWSFDASASASGTVSSVDGSLPTKALGFWDQQDRAAVGLVWLAKALGEHVFERTVPLTVLTRGVADLNPDAPIRPVHHGLVGVCSVIQKEYPAIVTKVLDLSSDPSAALSDPHLPSLIVSSLHEPLLAYVLGRWWKQSFDQVSTQQRQARMHDGGVYVFTGGLGGLARTMAIEIAGKFSNIKIALIARTPLPPEAKWASYLADDAAVDQPTVARTRQRILDFQKLQKRCEAKIYQANVASDDQLGAVLETIHSDWGAIDGVFHTAGILRDGVIATKDPADLREVFATKAESALACCRQLSRVTTEAKFLVFFSSIASDLGLYGQSDYSAANNYLDGLCASMNQISGLSSFKTFSINWPAFRDVGMAARSQTGLSDQAALNREILENSFTVAEGTEALVGVVNSGQHPRVAISKIPFADRHEAAIADSRSVRLSEGCSDASTESDNDSHDTDKKMLAIWADQFGNPNIGLDDDYFEMGGDSLMAMGLLTAIEQKFGKQMPISHLIGSPTPRRLIAKLGLGAQSDSAHATENSCDQRTGTPDHVVKLRTGSDQKSPLFLVHGADGAVMFYRDFANRVSTDRSIYAIASPFLQDADYEIPSQVEDIARQYINDLRTTQPSGPYCIGGYSFGGVVAYEIARQLEASGDEVEMLILYDIPNPANLEHNSAVERLKDFWNRQESEMVWTKSLKLTQRLGQAVKDRATVEIENRLAASRAKQDKANGFWRHKQARERHMTIEQGYEPLDFGGPLRVAVATDNGSKFRSDSALGWSTVSSNLSVIEVPGRHLELFQDPYLDAIVKATEEFLAET